MSVFLSSDPLSRNVEKIHEDPDNPSGVILESTTDIEPVLKLNQAFRREADPNARWTYRGGDDRGIGERVASIPMSVYYSLPKDLREDGQWLLKWLDDRDQMPFRTREGRLS